MTTGTSLIQTFVHSCDDGGNSDSSDCNDSSMLSTVNGRLTVVSASLAKIKDKES